MANIIKSDNSLEPIQIKTELQLKLEQTPQLGDIYIYPKLARRSSSDNLELIRLVSYANDDKTSFNAESYNVLDNTWSKHHNVCLSDLSNYYDKLLIEDFAKLFEDAKHLLDGTLKFDIDTDNTEPAETTALATKHDQSTLLSMSDSLDAKQHALQCIENAAQLLIQQQRDKMMQTLKQFHKQVDIIKKQLSVVMKAIALLELYMGEKTEIMQLTDGEVSKSETLSIRQLTLYMDEEMCDYKGYWQFGGADYREIEEFDKWLTIPANRDKVIPEDLSVVVFKPRRFDKRYSSDSMVNAIMNQWNHTTYVLYRDGDCLYRVYSEHVRCGQTVFPKQSELNKMVADAKYKDSLEDLHYDATKFMVLVNNLVHQCSLRLQQSIDCLKMQNCQYIYDAEPSLTDGHMSWKEFISTINHKTKVGSRILWVGAADYQHKQWRFKRWYASEWSCPSFPETQIHNVTEVRSETNKLNDYDFAFKYKPTFSSSGYDQTQYISFYFDYYDSWILYDELDIPTIDFYINNRVERVQYASMLPILQNLKQLLLKDLEQEQQFAKMFIGQHPQISEEQVIDAIKWWKTKNVWKRSLDCDDAKAFRMIQKHLNV